MLVVVGRPDPSAYRELARSLGVEERMRFVGATQDVYSWYAAADFFVLPTRHDPCSLVVLEALAMGLPVISTRQNGACEIMTSGEHGFVLVSADDRAGLINAMRTLCDPEARGRMHAACVALRPQLAYETHIDRLLRIYEDVRGRRGTPGKP
jgi:UDP-glucose:(heptosyl)LPS alpha-1,3-glucosyltransferase